MLCVNAFASEVKVDIQREISGDVINNTVSITGNLGEDHAQRPVTLTIYNSNTSTSDVSNIKFIEQTVSDSAGAASFSWSSSEEGEYSVKIRSGGCEHFVETSFALIGKTYYNSAVSAFQSVKTQDDVYSAMEEYGENIGLYTKFYISMADKSSVANIIIGKNADITFENLNNILNQSIVLGFLNSNEPIVEKNKLIEYYDESLFKLSGQQNAENIYSTYKNAEEAFQAEVLNKITGNVDSFDTFRENFNEAVILTGINKLKKDEVDKLITENNDFVGFSDYETLSIAQKSYIISTLMTSNINDMDSLRKAYTTALINNTMQPVVSGGRPSGGGGGSSFQSSETYHNKPLEVIGNYGLYKDINEEHWAYPAVEHLSEKGIIKGYGDGSFGTENNISRAEYIKLLTVAFNIPVNVSGAGYSDVDIKDWYYDYIMAATGAGICEGYDNGNFGPNESITREDMATILYRLALQKALISFTEVNKSVFKDIDSVSDYAKNGVNTLGVAGIISGAGDGMFIPKATATRAEAAQLIYNLLSKQ